MLRCQELLIPYGTAAGWEAAVWDHFQAVVRTVCQKLSRTEPRAHIADAVGGSTYTFVVWDGHPLQEEVEGRLRLYRQASDDLRGRVDAHNACHGIPEKHVRVLSYAGQCAVAVEPEE